MGRHPYCEVRLNDTKVSREHTRIEQREDGFYYIEDLQSRNGTLLNGTRLTNRQRLYDGDQINVCGFEFVFCSKMTGDQQLVKRTGTGRYSKALTDRTLLIQEMEGNPLNVTSAIKLNDAAPLMSFSDDNALLVREISSLRQKVRALSDMAGNLGKVVDTKELLQEFLNKLFVVFPYGETACLLTRNNPDEDFKLINWASQNKDDMRPIRVSRSMLEAVIQAKAGMLSDDVTSDKGFKASETMFRYSVTSIMAVPIFNHSEEALIGVVQVDTTDAQNPFTHDDLDLLVSLANQIGVYYENVNFHNTQIEEKITSQQVSVANRVQKGFLPLNSPVMDDYSFYDFYQPALHVGGDYYDYIEMADGKIAIALGDVSGKGIPAALLMAKLSSEVRYCLLLESDLKEVVNKLNQTFCEEHWEHRFVTFIIGILDPVTHRLHMVNAGHVLPIVSKIDGSVIELDNSGGFPLGVIADTSYTDFEYQMEPGDCMVFMSDGLTDAVNRNGVYFGLPNVKECLKNKDHSNAVQLGSNLVEQVHRYVGGMSQSDDQCLVVFGRNEHPISNIMGDSNAG